MRSRDETCRILESALSIATSGVDEAEVSLRGGSIGISQFSRNHLHPSKELNQEQLVVRLWAHGRSIACGTTEVSVDGARECAQQLRAEIDRLTPGTEAKGLPPPQSYSPIMAYDEQTAYLPTIERTALAARVLSAAIRASKGSIGPDIYRSRGGVYASGSFLVGRGGVGSRGELLTYAIANSRGLMAYHPSTIVSARIEMESDGRTSQGWVSSYKLDNISLPELIEGTLNKVLFHAHMGVLPPGTYGAVLDAEAVSSLVQIIGQQAGLAAMMEGRSFLAKGLGQQLVDERISIVDDHSHPRHNGAPFDCEGVTRQPVTIIDKGVGHSPVVGWASAKRWDRSATGHARSDDGLSAGEAASHLVMSGGEASLDTLLSQTRAGVLISAFDGLEVIEPQRLRVVGTTAHGMYAVEEGQRTTPLVGMRFDVSLLDVLSHVSEIGTSRWASGAVVPPIRLNEFPLYASI
ncbi:MAG: hypothetical protein KTR25_20535 [Myxococcales bacterium]|nr:hypothetical protein [Myxococcales bacterium]